MPKVIIDLRMVEGRLHGIARYALELARRLPALRPRWQFSALVGPRGLPEDLGPLTPEIPLHRCRVRFLSPLEQPVLAGTLFRLAPDLFHATSFSLPAAWPGRLVATLHDANHLALRQHYGPGRVAYYRLVVGPRARSAEVLLTDSEFSRQEIARHLRLNPYRLQVIFPGVDPRYQRPTQAEVESFRHRYRLPETYFVAVGNAKPHKNLELLARIAPRLPAPIALLAGHGTAAKLGFPASTLELPSLEEPEMPAFYGGALGLLLPSLYEGFGLPALEAMASGSPVLCAQSSSLPEVVGEAALMLSPDDPEAWITATGRLFRDEKLRQELSERGQFRAARFSWEDCAQRTLAAYERALSVGDPSPAS